MENDQSNNLTNITLPKIECQEIGKWEDYYAQRAAKIAAKAKKEG